MNATSRPVIYMAPLQGYTAAEWRRAHVDCCGGVDGYFTPFVRVEHDRPHPRDMRDACSPLDSGPDVTPQIIFNSVDEFVTLSDALRGAGHRSIDLNLGCPFTPQVRRHRGAGLLACPDIVKAVGRLIATDSDVIYSVKMRPGIDNPRQWRDIIDILADLPLRHITVHPRTAADQYRGPLHLDEYASLVAASPHPVIYNGEIHSPVDIDTILDSCPATAGVMVGRGMLARPTLALEWRQGHEMSVAERLDALGRVYRRYEQLLAPRLCGDSQRLVKLKTFWDYLEPEIGHKAMKAIRKSGSMSRYCDVVNTILNV